MTRRYGIHAVIPGSIPGRRLPLYGGSALLHESSASTSCGSFLLTRVGSHSHRIMVASPADKPIKSDDLATPVVPVPNASMGHGDRKPWTGLPRTGFNSPSRRMRLGHNARKGISEAWGE